MSLLKKEILKTEMTTDGDTGQQGIIIWLGTKSERTGRRAAKELIVAFNKKYLIPNLKKLE